MLFRFNLVTIYSYQLSFFWCYSSLGFLKFHLRHLILITKITKTVVWCQSYIYRSTSLYSLHEGTELSLINLAFSYEVIALTDLLSTFVLSSKVATNFFDCIHRFHNHAILYEDTAGHWVMCSAVTTDHLLFCKWQ